MIALALRPLAALPLGEMSLLVIAFAVLMRAG